MSPVVLAPPFRIGYRPAFDGLRAIAVALVMCNHLDFNLMGGWIGVDLFFVLSGFLITTLLLQEWQETGTIRLGAFYVRRSLRLWPALIALLVVMVLVTMFFAPSSERPSLWRQIATASTYTTNLAWSTGWIQFRETPLAHTWSLAIEEQFYLIWPPLLMLLLRARIGWRALLAFIGTVAVVAAAWTWILAPHTALWARVWVAPETRLPTLLAGCGLGVLATSGRLPLPSRAGQRAAAAATGFLAICVIYADRDSSRSSVTVGIFVTLAATMIIGHLVADPEGKIARVVSARLLVWLGRRSYGLYLWHLPVFYGVAHLAPSHHSIVLMLLQVGSSVAVAIVSYTVIETPFLRLKYRATSRSNLPPRHPSTAPLVGSQPGPNPQIA